MTQEAPANCEVCNEDLDPDHNAHCAFCGRIFHLTWDTRVEIKDCGRFDLDDETLALYFTCNICQTDRPQPPQGGLPPGPP